MLRLTMKLGLTCLVVVLPAAVRAAPWEDATMETIGVTGEWSNKVELADINGDGLPDVLFANGAGYAEPEAPEQNRVFLNQGAGMPFVEASQEVFGDVPDYTRAIKARDLDGDGAVDLLVANTFETQSRLFMGDGMGGFVEATDALPQTVGSFGDVELGDVDGDGDLDAVLADWGAGPANQSEGRTRLWLGDGSGGFVDATATKMPEVLVGWSWELELADVDNDLDLDVLVSCKSCSGSKLFVNDGAGLFTDASTKLPQFGNNYEFEAIDLTGDGFLDLVTINDGPEVTEHVFVGDGAGGFVDATAELWPADANAPGDDNMVAFLDVESDGDADFVIAGLFGNDDRLILNSGDGHLSLEASAFAPAGSSGTLGIAVADLNGDARLDVVMSEGEAPMNQDRVFFGVDVPVDTAAPRIALLSAENGRVVARIHDNKTPVMPHDFQEVVLRADGVDTPMRWYGEALWDSPLGAPMSAEVCAVDAAGNEACVQVAGGGETESGTGGSSGDETGSPTTGGPATTGVDETGGGASGSAGASSGGATGGAGEGSGCGCRGGQPSAGSAGLALLLALARRRRRY